MKSEEVVKNKIVQLEEGLEELEAEFGEFLEDEGIEEHSQEWEEPNNEFETKKEVIEKQIEVLQWVLV